MQHIFHHNSSGNSAFTNDLLSREVLRAISLHPVKQFKYQYRLHNFINQRKIIDLKQKSFLIEREIYDLTKKILKNSSINTNDQLKTEQLQDRFKLAPKLNKIRKATSNERRQNYDFDFFTRSLFASTYISPKRGLEGYWRNSLLDSVRQIMDEINRNSIERGRIIDFKDILYGYVRHHPLIGIDYIIDVLLVYRKYEGRKMTVPVRRHAYLRNSFTSLQFREDNLESSFYVDVPNEYRIISNDTFNNNNNNNNNNNGLVKRFLNLILPKGSNKNQINISDKKTDLKEEFQLNDLVKNKVINFIMPLTGRWQIFLRFMHNFEEICLKNNEYVTLVVVLFEKEGTEQTNLIQNLFLSFDKKYGDLTSIQLKLVVRKEAFSRSIGCEIGAAMFKENDLLFFVDVDIAFTRDFLFRARLNTIQYKQVYYPIVFSEYDPNDPIEALKPNSQEFKTEKQKQHFDFNENNGYWRQFGFGILLTYYSDLKQVGGFDTSIIGWGKEDVDLYEKYIKSNIFIFRSVDPGLTHVFHKIECDSKLSEEQMIMCLGSKATSIASQKILSDLCIKTRAHLIIRPPFLNTSLAKN
jgi:chondroitin sulfate synthase